MIDNKDYSCRTWLYRPSINILCSFEGYFLRCRGGGSVKHIKQDLDETSKNQSAESLNVMNSSFEKLIWSPEFADRGHDPLFMDGLTPSEAEYARSEWLKQVTTCLRIVKAFFSEQASIENRS